MSSGPTPIPVPVTVAQFRGDFPEFANTTTFPDGTVSYWLNFAQIMLDPARWSTVLGNGIELFAAHNIQLGAMNQAAINAGGLPGITKGPVSSEGEDGVSVSYAVASAVDPKAGHWNLTNYGTRFWQLSRLVGAGPLQIGNSLSDGSAIGLEFGPFGIPDTF